MKILVFSVYDSKAEAYLKPFFAPTIGLALRSMQAAVSDDQHEFCKYPGDYTLFQIGTYRDETGQLEPNPQGHVSLGTALEIKSTKPE